MAEKKIHGFTKFIFRGDTIENWEKINPILELKELVLILNQSNQTIGFKIGDGVTDFKNLETKTFDDGTIDLSNYYDKTETEALVKDNIKLWQPKTKYEVGDVVYGSISFTAGDEEVTQSYLFKCKEKHTSSPGSNSPEFPYQVDGEYWDSYSISCGTDGTDGQWIVNKYATKEELAEAIGQALEGDY